MCALYPILGGPGRLSIKDLVHIYLYETKCEPARRLAHIPLSKERKEIKAHLSPGNCRKGKCKGDG